MRSEIKETYTDARRPQLSLGGQAGHLETWLETGSRPGRGGECMGGRQNRGEDLRQGRVGCSLEVEISSAEL